MSATSRSSASARLRSCVRWFCATSTITPSLVRRLPARFISRTATSFGSEGERLSRLRDKIEDDRTANAKRFTSFKSAVSTAISGKKWYVEAGAGMLALGLVVFRAAFAELAYANHPRFSWLVAVGVLLQLVGWATYELVRRIGNDADAASFGHVVFVTVIGEAALNAIELAGTERFNDKTVIDVTNPLDFSV